MLNSKKVMLYAGLFLFSLLFFCIDHKGVVFGDYLFDLGGIPSRSNGDHGFHFPFIVGVLLITISSNLLIKQLKLKYKNVGRKMLLFSIVFLLCFPFLSRLVV